MANIDGEENRNSRTVGFAKMAGWPVSNEWLPAGRISWNYQKKWKGAHLGINPRGDQTLVLGPDTNGKTMIVDESIISRSRDDGSTSEEKDQQTKTRCHVR
jgi:hypothetical protein